MPARGLIPLDEMLERIDRALDRDRQWERLRAEVERRKALYEELKVEKERAEAADVAKTRFLMNISHELRTPLAAVLGFVDVLLDDHAAEPSAVERTEALHAIRRAGQLLLGIVNDILDLSRLEAGRLSLERTRFSPLRCVDDVVLLLGAQARERGLRLSADVEGDVPESMQGDPTRLSQILVNLVGNAIKFTHEGSVTVELSTVRDGGEPRIRFSVVDTGVGIAEEDLERLFRPFEQVDGSASRRHGGAGLGLAISQRLGEALGGRLEVQSEPGRGSTFTLELPLGPLPGARGPGPSTGEAARSCRVEPSGAASELPRLSCRVLLAEDAPDSRRVLHHLLSRAGADVEAVENGRLAVESACEARGAGKPFDVVLMDMQMPVMDGYEATRELRRRGYRGPIVALTAHALEDDRRACLDAGCDAYETKPVDRRRLIEVVLRHARGGAKCIPLSGT